MVTTTGMATIAGPSAQVDKTPRIGRIDQDEESLRRWAFQARGLWGVPIRVFERSLNAGGVSVRIWVAIIWPKGSK